MQIAGQVGPFRVISHIAKGGMGRVYLAEHEKKRRQVAIKVLPEKFLADRKRSQYLEREVKIAQKLRHPNVIDIYGLYRENGIGYLIMEYLDGGSLRQHITSRDLSLSDILDITLKICEGLHYIHNHKLEDGRFHSIIHMDIKPENILLSKNQRLKVADFGLSLSEDSWTIRKSRSRAGTPFYMSPEQIRGKNLDIRTDIYSLGLVIYELLTGQLPYKMQDRETYMKMVISRKTSPSPPSYLNNKIPQQFDSVTMKALEKKSGARYQTVTEMMLDLQRLAPILMPDDLAEGFRFMRSVKLQKTNVMTSEAPGGKIDVEAGAHGAESHAEKREEPAEGMDPDAEESAAHESAVTGGGKSGTHSEDGERLGQDLLQLHRELIHADDPGKSSTVRTAETKESEKNPGSLSGAALEIGTEEPVEEAAAARTEDVSKGEQEEPVGEFLPSTRVEPEAALEETDLSGSVPAALGENSGLVDAELVSMASADTADDNGICETTIAAEAPSKPIRLSEMEEPPSMQEKKAAGDSCAFGESNPEAAKADQEFGGDDFSSLDVDAIEDYIFIGRKKI